MKRLLVSLLSLCMVVGMFPTAVYAEEPAEEEVHHYDAGVVTTKATCTEDGVMTFTCKDCGDSYTEVIPAMGHEPNNELDEEDERVEPTCTKPGHEQYDHCVRCGKLLMENDEGVWCAQAIDDEETGELVLVKEGEGGRDLTKEDFEIEPTGHTYAEVTAQEPTCEEDGWYDYVACTVCKEEDGEEGYYEPGHEKVVIPATGHTPIPDPNDEEYKNRRCDDEEPKSVAAICSVCGKTLEDKIEIPIPDHKWKTVKAEEPTCVDKGWEEYEECSVCGATKTKDGKIHKDGKIPYIDALGHDFSVYVGATAGDCTHDGYLAGNKCSRCDAPDPENPYEPILAPGHKFEEIPQVDPDCTNPGVKAYYECSVCHELFEDDSEANKFVENGDITNLKTWKEKGGNGYIAPLGHKYETVIGKKATCEEDGIGACKECTRCGHIVYTDPDAKVIPAHGHSNEDGYWPENYQGHVGGDGEKRIVKDLFAPNTTKWNDAANEGITYCVDPADAAKAKPATCTEDGYQPAKLCLFCNEVLEESKVLPATGHDWTLKTPGTPPKCTLPGLSDLWECKNCGETNGGDTIQPTGHTWETVELQLSECNKDGHFAYRYCTVKTCGYAEAEKQDMIDTRLPKDLQKVASLNALTVSTMPTKGHPAEFVVAKYNHKYVEDVRPVDPTCTETGIAPGATRCLICGEHFNLVALKALGHDLVQVNEKKADCLNGGNIAYVYCERCGNAVAGKIATVKVEDITNSKIKQDTTDTTVIPAEFVVAALGHAEADGVKKNPTCTEDGYTAGKYCTRCGMTLEGAEVIPAHGHSNVDGYWPQKGYENAGDKRIVKDLIAAGTDWDTYFSKDYSEKGVNENITYKVSDREKARAKAPDCTVKGYDPQKQCIFCGIELEAGKDIAPLGHKAGPVQKPVDPTCTEYGYHGGIHCTVCENKLSQEAVTQYLKEHNYTALKADGWIVIPTLDNPLGHDKVEVAAKQANCLNTGNVAYVYCKRCGNAAAGTKSTVKEDDLTKSTILQNLNKLTEIPAEFVTEALGHDWIDVPGGTKTAATCLEAGTDGLHQCARCGKTEVKIIPALGHDVVVVEEKAPTCVDIGYKAHVYCARCEKAVSKADYEADENKLDTSDKKSKDFEIAPTGIHTWVHVDALRETCQEDGHTEGQECSVCKAANYTVIPANPEAYHAFLSTPEELAKLEWKVVNEGDGTPGSGMVAKMCPHCGFILAVKENPEVLKGDVNMDGEITPADAQLVLQYYVGIIDTLPNKKVADFNGDGEITPQDAQEILNAYLGF